MRSRRIRLKSARPAATVLPHSAERHPVLAGFPRPRVRRADPAIGDEIHERGNRLQDWYRINTGQ